MSILKCPPINYFLLLPSLPESLNPGYLSILKSHVYRSCGISILKYPPNNCFLLLLGTKF